MSSYTEVYNRFIRYKYRYEKALSIGITSTSKYYNLFCEIERRYLALSDFNEFTSNLCNTTGNEKKHILDTLESLLHRLGLRDSNSQLIKVKIKRSDTYKYNTYIKAKQSVNNLAKLDFNLNKIELDNLIKEYTSDIVLWYLAIRDVLYGEAI